MQLDKQITSRLSDDQIVQSRAKSIVNRPHLTQIISSVSFFVSNQDRRSSNMVVLESQRVYVILIKIKIDAHAWRTK